MLKKSKLVFSLSLFVLVVVSGIMFASGIPNIDTSSEYINPWIELKSNTVPFNVEVITKDAAVFNRLNTLELPVDLELKLPEQVGENNSEAYWVLKDQFADALEKTTALHEKLEQIAREGKPIIFVEYEDINELAKSFDIGFGKIDVSNNSAYKTVVSWVRYDEGIPDIGELTIPSTLVWEDAITSAAEITWVNRKGAPDFRRTANLEDKKVTWSPLSIESAEAYTGSSNINSDWTVRSTYTNYINDFPYGKVNQKYEFRQLTPDGDSSKDWFVYDYYTQLVPGYVLAPTDSRFATYVIDDFNNRSNATWYSSQDLYRYGPEYSASSSYSKSVDVGLNSPSGINAAYTYTWSVFDVEVIDRSDYSVRKADNKWDFNLSKNQAQNATIVNPAITTTVNQGNDAYVQYLRDVRWYSGGFPVKGYSSDSWLYIYNNNK